MPVFHEHKIIFFHIGKTGGFSIEKALGLGQLDYRVFDDRVVHGLNKGVMTQHARPGYVRDIVGDDIFNEYYKFTIVRNPWDRMVSAYHYLYDFHVKKFGDFPTWLKHKYDMVTMNKYKEGSHYTPQIEFTHEDGVQVVDYIGRFEQLNESFDYICKKVDISNISLPMLNKSKHKKKSYIEYYTPETVKLVEEMYCEDIIEFGYEK